MKVYLTLYICKNEDVNEKKPEEIAPPVKTLTFYYFNRLLFFNDLLCFNSLSIIDKDDVQTTF